LQFLDHKSPFLKTLQDRTKVTITLVIIRSRISSLSAFYCSLISL